MFFSITEGLLPEKYAEKEITTVDLNTAINDIIEEVDDDTKALQNLKFTLPEDEKFKYVSGRYFT